MRQTKNEQFYEQMQKAQNYAIDKVEKIKSDKKLPKFSRIMDFVKWVLLWVKVCIILVFVVKHPPFSFLFLFMRPDSYYT